MFYPFISIIIPVLNEEKVLTRCSDYYRRLGDEASIVFVDGGSSDHTITIAQRYGQVVSSALGRGMQKNCGASKSQAKGLLFLHVDSFLDNGALEVVDRALGHGAVGGCFTMRIEDRGLLFRLYEGIVNFRAKNFGVVDGDLGMFVRKDVYDAIGGFDHFSVMEDIVFSGKLRKVGRLHVLPNEIVVSSRRWHERGFMRTFWDYTVAYVNLWTGRLKNSS